MICELVVGHDKHKVSDLEDLIMCQDNTFYLDEIIGLAMFLDRSIKRTADLHLVVV